MEGNMAWIPRSGWLLVQKSATEERYGSLILTEKSRDRMSGWVYDVVSSGGPLEPEPDEMTGKLLSAGTPHCFQPGDWVLCPPRQAMDYQEEGLLLLPEAAVWAVITDVAGRSQPA
jgi:hypothetical protein